MTARAASFPPRLERLAGAAALLFATASVAAATAEELFFKDTTAVSEGELRFLAKPPVTPVHHHHNRVTITDASLDDGWVQLEQCHEHLDAVPNAAVTYRPGRVRNIRVTRAEQIGQAWAEAHSVELRDVWHGAVLCVQAETRALSRNDDSSFNLSNGPYMRKFLDGYYPMRVTLAVTLATDRLRFVEAIPQDQPGFHLWQQDRQVGYDTVFEGLLSTVLRFDLNP